MKSQYYTMFYFLHELMNTKSYFQLYSFHCDIRWFDQQSYKLYLRKKSTLSNDTPLGRVDILPTSLMWNISFSVSLLTHPHLHLKEIIKINNERAPFSKHVIQACTNQWTYTVILVPHTCNAQNIISFRFTCPHMWFCEWGSSIHFH